MVLQSLLPTFWTCPWGHGEWQDHEAALRVSVSENTLSDLGHKGFLLCSPLSAVWSWFFHSEFSPLS